MRELPQGRALSRLMCRILLLVSLAGCRTATSPLVDWNSRIGNYSYPLALQDLGVPLRSTTLGDGSIVADWRTRKGTIGSPDVSDISTTDASVTPNRPDNPIPLGSSPTPDHYLRLTFGPDQQLSGWKKYSQYYWP
jgi:hypothetical protein